jgi:hypothetical protein
MFVVVKKMDAHAVLAQEIVERAIGIEAAKDVEVFQALHGDKLGRHLLALFVFWHKPQRVVLPFEAARVEKIVRVFHGEWCCRYSMFLKHGIS